MKTHTGRIFDVIVMLAIIGLNLAGIGEPANFFAFCCISVLTLVWLLLSLRQERSYPIFTVVCIFIWSGSKLTFFAEPPIGFETISLCGACLLTILMLLLQEKNVIRLFVCFLVSNLFLFGALSYMNVALSTNNDTFVETVVVQRKYTYGALIGGANYFEIVSDSGSNFSLMVPRHIFENTEIGEKIYVKGTGKFYLCFELYDKSDVDDRIAIETS